VAMRAEDILVSTRYLRERAARNEKSSRPEAGRVELIGIGEAGPAALHAAATEPDLFARLTLRRSLDRWSDVVQTPVTQGQLINVVHGALKHYDLPDLVNSLAETAVRIEEPVGATNERLSQ